MPSFRLGLALCIESAKSSLNFVELCRILVYELGYVWTCVVLGVDRLRVGFESDSCIPGLPYNEGGTTRCNL
jgi:hypothetical protein